MSNDVIADSSYLYALFNQNTKQYEQVLQSSQQIRGRLLVLSVVLTEVAYLFRRVGGVPAVAQFLTSFVAAQPNLETIETPDLINARDIMNRYPAADLDFVDCCIVAVAERLQVEQNGTLDRRDFGIIRPKHIDHFILLP